MQRQPPFPPKKKLLKPPTENVHSQMVNFSNYNFNISAYSHTYYIYYHLTHDPHIPIFQKYVAIPPSQIFKLIHFKLIFSMRMKVIQNQSHRHKLQITLSWHIHGILKKIKNSLRSFKDPAQIRLASIYVTLKRNMPNVRRVLQQKQEEMEL